MIKDFVLNKTGGTASIRVLQPSDIQSVLHLQDVTRAALPEGQKMFVLPQSQAYFEQLLARQSGLVLGVFAGDVLIGQMVAMGPLSLGDVIDQQKLTRNEVHFHHASDIDSVFLAKSMTVHPDWRGNEISQHMLEAVLDLPLVRATDHVFAQISVDNVRSWELFLEHGFGIVAAVVDPNDHKPRFIVQKPGLGFAAHEHVSVANIDPVTDFASIMRLTQREALIGSFDTMSPTLKLAFSAGINSAVAWYDHAESA